MTMKDSMKIDILKHLEKMEYDDIKKILFECEKITKKIIT